VNSRTHSPPLIWRRFLGVLRILLGFATFAGLLSTSSIWRLNSAVLVAAALLIYGAIALLWKRFDQLGHPLLTLVLDTVFFLVCITYIPEPGLWLSSFFYFYLLLTAALLHTWREVLLEAGVCMAFFYLARPAYMDVLWPTVILLAMFASVITFHQRLLSDRLSGASEQAVLFRAEAEHAREAERQRIAADFHDGPLQSVISFQMRLEVVRKMLQRDFELGMRELEQLQDICRAQVIELRAFVKSMRPVQYGETLGPAFRRIAGDFQKDSGIPVNLTCPDDLAHAELPNLKDLIPVLREALHNVQKHSRASRVAVTVMRDNGQFEMMIEDDGQGYPFCGTFTLDELEMMSVGPASIERRVRNLKGDLTLESRPGRGSTLRVQVPA
jgi:signal transduction histidine kinase